MIRLIASDVDGTILPRGGELSKRTLRAVAACRDAGVHFVLASGRWFVSAKVIADALGQRDGYMIISGGGAISDMQGAILKEWTLETAQAWRIYEIAQSENVMINAFIRNAVYRVNTHALNAPVRGLAGYLGDTYHIINDEPDRFEKEGLVTPYKMEVYGSDPLALGRLQRKLCAEGFSVASSFSTNLEIMAPGCGKGTAVGYLADYLNIPFDERMAFGDNRNDLSMFSAVGWPVAVSNATSDLKRSARIIAPDCSEDGVAQVIERALKGDAFT